MNIFEKHKIAKLIKEKNYQDLTCLLNKENEKDLELVFKNLSRVDINSYLKFLVRNQLNQKLILALALYSPYIKMQDVIFYIDFKVTDKKKLDALIASKFPEFLDLIKKKYIRNDIISYLIKYCIKNNQGKELALIEEELLKGELTPEVIRLFYTESLYSLEFKTKLIASGPVNIITYLKRPYNSASFLEEYINNYPKIKDLKLIAKEFLNTNQDIYYTLIKLVLKLDNTNPYLKSEYLLCLLEVNFHNIYQNEIIDNIMNLNELNVVKKLMNQLDCYKQEEIKNYYLNIGNLEVILTLAIVTDGSSKYKLIDYLLEISNSVLLTHLIGNLEGEYLNYALTKILKEKEIIIYLNLINNLYLYGYNCLPTIDFIFIANIQRLFDSLIITRLLGFRESLVNKLTLIKK